MTQQQFHDTMTPQQALLPPPLYQYLTQNGLLHAVRVDQDGSFHIRRDVVMKEGQMERINVLAGKTRAPVGRSSNLLQKFDALTPRQKQAVVNGLRQRTRNNDFKEQDVRAILDEREPAIPTYASQRAAVAGHVLSLWDHPIPRLAAEGGIDAFLTNAQKGALTRTSVQNRRISEVIRRQHTTELRVIHEPNNWDVFFRDVLPQYRNLHVLELADHRKITTRETEDLGRALAGLTGLQRLRLRFLQPEGFEALAPALRGLTNLTYLDLSGNGISGGAAVALSEAIESLTGLTFLNLSFNVFTGEVLAPALQPLLVLESLYLWGNRIGDNGAAAMAPALGRLTRLLRLDLSQNEIGDNGAAALAPALGRLTRLSHLDLSHNQIGSMAPALRGLTGLVYLSLGSTGIGGDGMVALAPSLERMTALRTLDLFRNNIGVEGARALVPVLRGLTGLIDLNLNENDIRVAGVVALVPELRRLTSLTSLSLGLNGLDTRAVVALAPALQTRLTRLYLPGNQIDDEGAAAIAAELPRLTRLTDLNLSHNRIGDVGARALLTARRLNGLTIRLDRNRLSPEGTTALRWLFAHEPTGPS